MANKIAQRLKLLREKRLANQKERSFSLLKWFGIRRTSGFLLLAAFIVLRIWDPAQLENLRLRGLDFYQVLKPRSSTMRPVVIVDIDEASLQALGQWPWPRTLLAELIEKIQASGSVAIGLDVIMSEPDRMSPALVANSLPQIDAETRKKMAELPSNDEVLAQVISKSKIILGQSATNEKAIEAPDLPSTGFAKRNSDPAPFLIKREGLLRNTPVLELAAKGRGVVTIENERDNVIRRVPLVMMAGDQIVPSLALEMLRVVVNPESSIMITTQPEGISSVTVPGLELPTDENGQMWIYFTHQDWNRYVSAKDVIAGKIPADRFAGRLALIGTSAIGLQDIKATPVEKAMPGVEIHAQVLENALTQEVLSRPNYAVGVEIVITALVGSILVAVSPWIGATTLIALGLSIAALLAAGSWYMYVQHGLLFDVTFPLIAIFVTYMTLVFINYFREQADRRRIRSAFSRYLSPDLVEQLANSPKKLELGGETRNMTILFSDVRGFTTISESFKNDPQGLTELMNRLLTPLTNSIVERKGTIDKYIGDAIMAFWNAPLDDRDHETHACAAALDMLRKMAELNREREAEALEDGKAFFPINIGLGINTGTCVVGNMGSDLRFDYSVLGDPVNLASRLEGRSKSYGTPIILGANTAEKVGEQFATVQIDLITVKGKTEPEHIYALVGDGAVAKSDEFTTFTALVRDMMAYYRKRDWSGAETALQRAKFLPQTFGLTEVLDLYQARIDAFRVTPPPERWDGVFAFDTK